MMKKMTVREFKTHFSNLIEQMKSGERVAVTFDKTNEVIGYFLREISEPKAKRKLGILEGRASVNFHPDFKITGEEFLGS